MKAESRKQRAEMGAKARIQAPAAEELLKAGQKYLTRVELARVLRVSVRKVDSMVANREIPVLHLGKAVRFRLEDVERRLNETMLTRSEAVATDR